MPEGFELTMQEEEALNTGGHVSETLGWFAIEAGGCEAGGIEWLAGHVAGVTDATTTAALDGSLAGGAHVVASLSSFSGADPAWARGSGSSDSSFDVSLEEEQSGDAETAHVGETVDYFAFDAAGLLPTAPLQAVMETGTLSLTHAATSVTLAHSYDTPVVIAHVASETGVQPVNVRVSSVIGDQLTLQLQEPNHLDGWHVAETVNYLVVEAGRWILPDGSLLEAGTLQSQLLSPQGFETVGFSAAFDGPPVVLSQVQSFNGSDFVTTRQMAIDETGFQLTMQEEEARNGGGHVPETLGWVALEGGSGNAGSFSWLGRQQCRGQRRQCHRRSGREPRRRGACDCRPVELCRARSGLGAGQWQQRDQL